MTFGRYGLLACAIALGGVVSASPAFAADEHNIVSPQDVKWGAAPGSLPAGAQAALLMGDPAKEGLFILRIKMPKGYHIPPHSHPKPEVVTILSGTLTLGMGEKGEPGKGTAVPVGGFFAMPAGGAHFATATEDTILQISSIGPWGITYFNPKDDPRNK